MGQQLQMLTRSQFVVQRNQNAATIKNGVGGDQPLRLVAHDDGGAIAFAKSDRLERGCERQGRLLELGVSQTLAFAVTVGLDEAQFVRELIQRVTQCWAEAGVLGEIKHARSEKEY